LNRNRTPVNLPSRDKEDKENKGDKADKEDKADKREREILAGQLFLPCVLAIAPRTSLD
jgi:hypothetical protein